MNSQPTGGSRERTIQIIADLSERVRSGRTADYEQNTELWRYLEAAAAWMEGMDGYYLNRGEPVPETPTWETIADIFRAALVYE